LPNTARFRFAGCLDFTGLEYIHDDILSGKSGGEIWVVDPAASRVKRVAQKTPEPGADFQCSLDINLQRVAEEQLSVKKDLVGLRRGTRRAHR